MGDRCSSYDDYYMINHAMSFRHDFRLIVPRLIIKSVFKACLDRVARVIIDKTIITRGFKDTHSIFLTILGRAILRSCTKASIRNEPVAT